MELGLIHRHFIDVMYVNVYVLDTYSRVQTWITFKIEIKRDEQQKERTTDTQN